jgi:hypothetical protein
MIGESPQFGNQLGRITTNKSRTSQCLNGIMQIHQELFSLSQAKLPYPVFINGNYILVTPRR